MSTGTGTARTEVSHIETPTVTLAPGESHNFPTWVFKATTVNFKTLGSPCPWVITQLGAQVASGTTPPQNSCTGDFAGIAIGVTNASRPGGPSLEVNTV